MWDMAVIGAGFGGLGALGELSRAGVSCAIFEQLKYPGGCASTFTRFGRKYQAGATLIAGMGRGQLFEGLCASTPLDPVIELRCQDWVLTIPSRRDDFVTQFPSPQARRFFALQKSAADSLWPLLDDPSNLELTHLWKAASPSVLRFTGRPLRAVLDACDVDDNRLRLFCDALCQITVQTDAAHAEAPFALATLDYPFRGAHHVEGGVGELAWAMLRKAANASVHLADSVKRLEPGFLLHTRRGTHEAKTVIANLLPSALTVLSGVNLPRLEKRVRQGWGACMLYLALKRPLPPKHLQLIDDPAQPLIEGNHLFCSTSGDTCTVSTHVFPDSDPRPIQKRMLETLKRRAPDLWEERESHFTASPRTFERFTGRPGGLVGGIPRKAGLAGYLDVLPPRLPRGLFLCGDSIFPGQSALAAALGGMLAARKALRLLE